jgi:hypothetical protein
MADGRPRRKGLSAIGHRLLVIGHQPLVTVAFFQRGAAPANSF